MKKFWLFATLLCWTLLLVWCCPNNHEKTKAFCLNKWWTYSIVFSADEEYWECAFPSGVGCRDDIMLDWMCQYEPDTSSIDSEEKRLDGCNQNANDWVNDFLEWAKSVEVIWWDEAEGWASFVRNWVVHYTKDWDYYNMTVECVADFVDWSLSTSYWEEVLISTWDVIEDDWDAIEDITEGTWDEPLARMVVEEWQTSEETQANLEEACSNVWWALSDWNCVLEDWTIINF